MGRRKWLAGSEALTSEGGAGRLGWKGTRRRSEPGISTDPPGREAPGTGRVGVSEVSPGRAGAPGTRTVSEGQVGGLPTPADGGADFGADSPGRQGGGRAPSPAAGYPLTAHRRRPSAGCWPQTRAMRGCCHAASSRRGLRLVAQSKGLRRPVFRAREGKFETAEEGGRGGPVPRHSECSEGPCWWRNRFSSAARAVMDY